MGMTAAETGAAPGGARKTRERRSGDVASVSFVATLASLRALQRDPLAYLAATRREGSTRRRLAVPGFRAHLVFEPELAQQVLTKHALYGRCALVFDRLKPLTGDRGLVQLEGAAWKPLRERFARMFSDAGLDTMRPALVRHAERVLGAVAASTTVDAVAMVTRYVLGSTLETFAGGRGDEAGDDDLAARFLALNAHCGARMLAVAALPSLTARRLRRELNEAVARHLPTTPLAPGLDPKLALDQLKTFLFAAHETTTSSIVSSLHLLATHPEHQETLHAAPEAACEALLLNVYKEALRLYPPAWLIVRTARQDDAAAGVARGDHMLVAVRELHRDPRHWRDPEQFLPERHAHGRPAPGTYLPYGAGPKMCIGARLAPLSAVTFLKDLLARFRVVAEGPLTMKAHITLFPVGTVPLRMEARR